MTIKDNTKLTFTKKKGYEGTIRKVWYKYSADTYGGCDTFPLGLVGKETELVEVGVISIEGRKPNKQTWMCIPDPDHYEETCRIGTTIGFGATRREAIEDAIFIEKEEEDIEEG